VNKAHMPPPTPVGGKDATNVNDASKAYGQLAAMAEQLRALSPHLTFAQAFARVYTQPRRMRRWLRLSVAPIAHA
jgi:hypothetical protein